MGKLICILFLLQIGVVSAQTITIFDADSKEPIDNVVVYNTDRSKTTITNFEGKCDLSKFNKNERLIFNHIGYHIVKYSKKNILKQEGHVFLNIKAQQLQEVVMSISKWEQQKKDIPHKIAAISARTIAFSGSQTAADVLQSSGKVFVQKSQLGGGSPMIRGFATNRLSLSVDGVRMNNAIFRGGNIQNIISIDPFTIKNTEIIFGPGSVIYGSDAIGGVMNFYTKKPILSYTDTTLVMGSTNYRFASANNENTLHFDINLGKKKWAFLSSISYNNFGDLTMGEHGPDSYLRTNYVRTENGVDFLQTNSKPKKQVTTGYDQLSLMQKVLFKPSNYWNLSLGTHFSQTSNYNRYDRLIRPNSADDGLKSAEWYYGPQKWFMTNLQLNKKGKGKFYDGLKMNVAYQHFEESRHDRDFNDTELFSTQENVDAFSTNIDLENKKIGNLRLYYGLEYLFNKVYSKGSSRDIVTFDQNETASRYPNGSTWQTTAAYISGEYKVNPNITLLSGLRYSHVWIDADFDNTFYSFPFDDANVNTGALTGSLGFSWFPKSDLQITWNGSTGFRAPNIDDVGKIFDSEPGSVVVPNPDLVAEYAYNTEVGIQKNFNDKLVIKGATFYTYLVDALVRRDFLYNGEAQIEYRGELSNVQAIQNAAKAYVYGFELGTEAFVTDNFSITSNITFTQGIEEEDDGTDSPGRHVAPTFGDLHFIWNNQLLKTDLFVNYNGEISNENLAVSEQSKAYMYALNDSGLPYSPSWYTLNLRTQIALTNALKLNFNVENITNQRYKTYSSGIVAPGINIILGASYQF